MGLYGMKEKDAVKVYDALHPGVNIPTEQKHERVEREAVKERYGLRDTRRARTMVGSLVVPGCDTCRELPYNCKCPKED